MNVEKLNLWDRLFNRRKKIIIGRGKQDFHMTYEGQRLPNSEYQRSWVEYKIIDRLTGSETIMREYLD